MEICQYVLVKRNLVFDCKTNCNKKNQQKLSDIYHTTIQKKYETSMKTFIPKRIIKVVRVPYHNAKNEQL